MNRRSSITAAIVLAGTVAVAAVAAGPGGAAEPAAEAVSPAVARLAEAVRFRTISPQRPEDFDPAPFLAFIDFLERSYPRTHAALELERVAGYSLLYTWRGSDPSLEPILLTSHHDVVPVTPGSLERWTVPPFDGLVADGYVWGRGTMDDKVGVLATLEGVESLVAEGFRPVRTVHLAFGHDEELGGDAGAKGITDLLESRGVRLWFSLDEGMAIAEGIAGLSEPVAMIGVAEKGYLTLELTTRATGGHSSMPPRDSAIGRLARVVEQLEANPMPAHLDGIVGDMFDTVAPKLPFGQRFALGQRWLLGPFVRSALSAEPTTNAMIRTTTAVTMVRGGVKANVLPSRATVTANFRIHPSDRVDDVVERVREIVDDPEVEIEIVEAREASPVASRTSDAYAVLSATLQDLVPGIPVAPALVMGGTDSKHYSRIAGDSYRFTPVKIGRDDASRVHGIDERVAIEQYERMPRFYRLLIERAAGPPAG